MSLRNTILKQKIIETFKERDPGVDFGINV